MINTVYTYSFHIGQIVYIVKNTPQGPTMQQFKVVKIFHALQSIIIEAPDKSQTKIYKDDLSNLLTETQAKIEYEKIKDRTPLKAKSSSEVGTFCHYCGHGITKSKNNYCPICHGYECPICGKCFCRRRY